MEDIREHYWRRLLITIILELGVILFFRVTPFLGGILGAFTIYILLRGQMFHLTEKLDVRPAFAALLLLGETILCFLIPITLMIWLVINKTQNTNLDPTVLLDTGQHMVGLAQEKTGSNALGKGNLLKVASILPQIRQFLVGSIGDFTVSVVILIFILYFMLISGRRMKNYLYTLFPFSDRNKDKILSEINMIVESNTIDIPLSAVTQGIVAVIDYFIFQTPGPLLFEFLTCIATIIPIIGTALVWVPLAAYMVLNGGWVHTLGLAIYVLLVITNVDNLIRFILQKELADTHPLVTVFGIIIGLSLFGFMGIIFGPLLLSLFLFCIGIFKRSYSDK